jgi:hypothetical protein
MRAAMSAPSPGISQIRSPPIQVGLESTLGAGFSLDWNWDRQYLLENGWNIALKAGIWMLWKAYLKASMPKTSISMKWRPLGSRNGHPFVGA